MSYSGSKRKRISKSFRPYKRRATPRTVGLAPPRTGGYFPQQRRRRRMTEKKAIDLAPANYNITTTATATLLNAVATGTDFTDRIGRSIDMKSLYIRGLLKVEDNTCPSGQLCRMIIVYDRQPNASALTITDILKTADVTSQLNLNNRDRFKVVCDKQWVLGPIDTTATQALASSPAIIPIKIYKKLNLPVLFGGTTATIGSINTGSLYMVLIGLATAGSAANLYVSTRVRFEDS